MQSRINKRLRELIDGLNGDISSLSTSVIAFGSQLFERLFQADGQTDFADDSSDPEKEIETLDLQSQLDNFLENSNKKKRKLKAQSLKNSRFSLILDI